ncbi:MAG TPA: enoyl-CoA hydratase-related protein [Candidatus Dormibacteraeota bacterium]
MGELALYEVRGAVATLTLNRPDHMNTLNQHLLEEVSAALEAAAADDAVRVVIMTGRGRAFSAGGDLTSFAAGTGRATAGSDSPQARIDTLRQAMRTSELLQEMPKVTIAAINGACAGAGLAWACAADLRYCADSARFNTAFMTAGLSGDFGGTWTLPRIVGPARARELFLLAEKFSAQEAARIGLVSQAFPADQLMSEVDRVAQRVAGFSPLAARALKANLNDGLTLSFAELLDHEAERQIRCGMTRDAREAAAAFLEKRAPVFEGR